MMMMTKKMMRRRNNPTIIERRMESDLLKKFAENPARFSFSNEIYVLEKRVLKRSRTLILIENFRSIF